MCAIISSVDVVATVGAAGVAAVCDGALVLAADVGAREEAFVAVSVAPGLVMVMVPLLLLLLLLLLLFLLLLLQLLRLLVLLLHLLVLLLLQGRTILDRTLVR